MAGKLQVSVIEARNVQADVGSDLDFYVRLRFGGQDIRTDIARQSPAPKFLKDIRFDLEGADVLRVEMLQVGPKGDLIIGTTQIPVQSLADSGTLVQWFPLKDTTGAVTAELCLVLRASQAGSPMSASHVAATEKAKAQAIAREEAAARERARKLAAKRARRQRDGDGGNLPLPLALAGAVLAAAAVYLWRKRPVYYEVQEGDTLCTIGVCHNRHYEELFQKNNHIVSDPHVIYPGDRLRIK
ncbi:hypothetical protein WJX72_002695 [[Myrmecia] bisecta]|uniref:LysM domain-containing protein n=1 Tax=[Myrmecia] bisecta TaxID=41462 RepID=A0AAW1PSC1_9CHLO